MNNQMNFDPMTGLPINNNGDQNNSQSNFATQNNLTDFNSQQVPQSQPTRVENEGTVDNSFQNIEPVQSESSNNIQQQMQNIPTVDQSKQEFIDKTQAINTPKKEEKKDGPNIVFIIFLFAIIFASIFFLFPYLLEVL